MQREIYYDEVFDAQKHYRLVLDSMARPGKINVLPRLELNIPAGIHAAGALVGFALLNSDVAYCVEGPEAEVVSRYLLVNTSARPVAREEADYVFLVGAVPAALLYSLKVGTLPYPEDSATVIAMAEQLANEGEGIQLLLNGPGIDGERKLCVNGLDRSFFEALTTINGEFPLGVDLILTDSGYRVACIPRSTRVRVV
ncbi:MAG TPA: phosphonate C-P lyase system protein PhnH [Puia sp.]|jgi:alpha-D-ribose 1-methylphosphonate 5-triphosphate synthase subunit PhnH|nr:phosphonate C-P lyase system protein PhnH [Puia sp.]